MENSNLPQIAPEKRRSSILKLPKSPENPEQEIELDMATRETRRVSFAKVAVIKEFSVTASSSENESTAPSLGNLSALDKDLHALLTAPIINNCRSSDIPAEIWSEKTEQIGPRRPSQNKRAPLQPIVVLPEDYSVDKANTRVACTTALEKTMVLNEDMSVNTLCTSIWPEDEVQNPMPTTNKTLILNNEMDTDMTASFTSNINLCQPANKTVCQDVDMNTEMTDQVEVAHRNRLLSQLKSMTLMFPTNVTKSEIQLTQDCEKTDARSHELAQKSSANLRQVGVVKSTAKIKEVAPPQVDGRCTVKDVSVTSLWDISSSEQKRWTSSSSRSTSKMDTQQTTDNTDSKCPVVADSRHGLQLISARDDSPAVFIPTIPPIERTQVYDASIQKEEEKLEALHEEEQLFQNDTERVRIEEVKVEDLNISSLSLQRTDVTGSVNSRDLTESVASDRSVSYRLRSDIEIGKKAKAFGVKCPLLDRLKAAQRLSKIDSGDEDTTKYESLQQTQSKNKFTEIQPVIENRADASLTAVNTVIPQVTQSLNGKPPRANSPPIACAQNSSVSSLKRKINTKAASPQKKTRNQQEGFPGFEESLQDEDLIDNQSLELVGDYSSIHSSPAMCSDINASLKLGKHCVQLETIDTGADKEIGKEAKTSCTSECGSNDESIDLLEISNMLDKFDEVENMCDKLIQALPPSELLDQIEIIDKEIAEAETGVAKKFAKLDELLQERKGIYKKKVFVKQKLKMKEKEIRELQQSQRTHDSIIRKFNIEALLKRQYYEWTLEKLTPKKFLASFLWNTFKFRVTFGENVKRKELPPNCVCRHVISTELIPNPEGLNVLDNVCKLVHCVVWEHLQDKQASWNCSTTQELPDILDEISTVVGRARMATKDIRDIFSFEQLATRDGTKIDFTPSKVYLCNFLVNLNMLDHKLGDYMPEAVDMLRCCVREAIVSDSFITAEERSLYYSKISKSMNAYFKNLGD